MSLSVFILKRQRERQRQAIQGIYARLKSQGIPATFENFIEEVERVEDGEVERIIARQTAEFLQGCCGEGCE